MFTFVHDVWAAFKAARDARRLWPAMSRAQRRRAARQAARFALMSDEQLQRSALEWGGALAAHELTRRGRR